MVYTVANEGARLDIPEGPLGRLISGLQLSKYSYLIRLDIYFIQIPYSLTDYLIFCMQSVGRNHMNGQVVRRFSLDWWTSSTQCVDAVLLSFVHSELWVEL